MRYRLYRPNDFARLYALEEICFQPPERFPRSYMHQLVQSTSAATWIAADDSNIAGFAIVKWSIESSENSAYIETIEVAPEYRRRGIALALLEKVESAARTAGCSVIWLHVEEKNQPALRLYQAQGYQKEGKRSHYYGRNRSALVYAKLLHN